MGGMTGAEVIAAIRAKHLKANVSHLPADALEWDSAWVDAGGGIFGEGPYLKVPIRGHECGLVVRVYAHERLRKRLARDWVGSIR